jgi:putative heme-binding domain-containing protein
LTSNASGARAVLEGIRSGSLGGREILAPTDARRIVELGPELSELLNEVWGTLRPLGLDRVQQVADWKQVLTTQRLAEADLNHGRAVYAKTCQRCHVLYGIGETVGPELTGSNRTDLDYLLRNLIDPSAEIPADYRATIVATHEGRIVNGVLLRETDEILVLASETGRIELAQSEVEARRTDPNSLMPEGQLDALEEAEVVDLVAYLGSSGQVPRRLLAGEGGELFDGKTLAGWSGADGLWTVEEGEIVGRAIGLEHNEYLISDHDLRDFRLVLEIQLTPDSGNSGIQVRSQPFEEHSMQGFQVDAGQIHWGTLYEVHGRNALVTDVPSAHRAGEWNTYEILYTGSRIQVALNGVKTIDLDDDQGAVHGRLGFQLHQGQSMTVRFRNLKLELDPTEPGLKTIS